MNKKNIGIGAIIGVFTSVLALVITNTFTLGGIAGFLSAASLYLLEGQSYLKDNILTTYTSAAIVQGIIIGAGVILAINELGGAFPNLGGSTGLVLTLIGQLYYFTGAAIVGIISVKLAERVLG